MKKKRKIRRIPIAVPVASMGDIAFLLIIFFVVCSQVTKDSVRVDPPRSIDVDKLKRYALVVAIDNKGQIHFQGNKIDSPESLETRIAEEVEGRTDPETRTVMLRCDKSVRKSKFEAVMEAIAEGGGRIAAVGDKPTKK